MHKIQVSNFMALKDVAIDIPDLVVLLGEQASGKSTLSKLVYFFRSLKDEFIDHIVDLAYGEGQKSEYFNDLWQKIGTKFYNYFGSTRHLEPFKIIYHYGNDGNLTLGLKADKSLDINFSPPIDQMIRQGQQRVDKLKQVIGQSNTAERRAFQQELKLLQNLADLIFSDPCTPLFIPAGRNITVNYSSQFQRDFYSKLHRNLDQIQSAANGSATTSPRPSADLYMMSQFLDAVDRWADIFKDKSFEDLMADRKSLVGSIADRPLSLVVERFNTILKGEYTHDRYGEKIYLEPESYIYLNNASSGQQEAIRILQDAFLIILQQSSAFRVIEEPEAHLYPLAQKSLMEVLTIVLNTTPSQLILTTHSPYILSIINNLLFAHRVVAKNPAMAIQIESIIPPEAWLNSKKVGVYFLQGGNCENIFDPELGLIDQNRLDEISEVLGEDFNQLYQLHSQAFAPLG
jgi:energy-coupling factor transporter ATP-binding protein EcfA2